MSTSHTHAKPARTALRAAKKTVRNDDISVDASVSVVNAVLQQPERHTVFHESNERQVLIAEAAYRLAEQRGFVAGRELDDWLAAETEVDARLLGEGRVY